MTPNKKNNAKSLLDLSENLSNYYSKISSPHYRKKRGQYFTSKNISKFMVAQFENIKYKNEIKILDPGCGTGIFESAFCDYIKHHGKNKKVHFDLYENDKFLIPFLDSLMETCQKNLVENGIEISYKIINEDFILSISSMFNDNLDNSIYDKNKYDFIITNPPYYKIRKNSAQAISMENIIYGQPNIYTLFMALSAKLLKNNGEIVIITPRSYFSGPYFKRFRKWFFEKIKPHKIHIFTSRRVFKQYNVQQEMVILFAKKSHKIPKNIKISTSNDDNNIIDHLNYRYIPYDKILIKNENDLIVRIPISKEDEIIAEKIDEQRFKLFNFNLKTSTGPVVPFRTNKHLLYNIDNKNSFFPLIWMQNLRNRFVEWPIQINNKPIAIKDNEETKKLLVPNSNYIFIKRFSTKEGKNRINAYIFLEKYFDYEYIGIENHINYIFRINGKLTEREVYGITAVLNSKIYNQFFQMTNGSTQVNASEINNIPLLSIREIKSIGEILKKGNDKHEIEEIICDKLKIGNKIV